MKKRPSKKQIAARKLFARRAKSGAFKKKKSTGKKSAAPKAKRKKKAATVPRTRDAVISGLLSYRGKIKRFVEDTARLKEALKSVKDQIQKHGLREDIRHNKKVVAIAKLQLNRLKRQI